MQTILDRTNTDKLGRNGYKSLPSESISIETILFSDYSSDSGDIKKRPALSQAITNILIHLIKPFSWQHKSLRKGIYNNAGDISLVVPGQRYGLRKVFLNLGKPVPVLSHHRF